MFLFLYPPEPQGSFLCGVAHATVRERSNIISSCLTARFCECYNNGAIRFRFLIVVEKSGGAWYNGFIKADNPPDKSEFIYKGEY